MQNPEESSKTAQHQPDQLKILEYAAVAASAVGSVAAAWFEQILFAATPLTLAAALNLINRQRFEQRLGRYTTSAIADIKTVAEQLPQQIQPQQTDPQFLREPVTDSQLQSDLNPIIEAVTELQRVTQQLDQNMLRQQDWEIINVRFKLLEETIEQFKQGSSTDELSLDHEADQQVAEPADLPQPATDLSAIQSQIYQLHNQVIRLDQQNRTIVKPYLLRLARTVKELQQHQ